MSNRPKSLRTLTFNRDWRRWEVLDSSGSCEGYRGLTTREARAAFGRKGRAKR